jgi:hypothetical protein
VRLSGAVTTECFFFTISIALCTAGARGAHNLLLSVMNPTPSNSIAVLLPQPFSISWQHSLNCFHPRQFSCDCLFTQAQRRLSPAPPAQLDYKCERKLRLPFDALRMTVPLETLTYEKHFDALWARGSRLAGFHRVKTADRGKGWVGAT